MSLTARVLPVEEWPRLAQTGLSTAGLDASRVFFVVIEQGEELIGYWPMTWALHANGVWIAPPYRRRGAVARRLLRAVKRIAGQLGVPKLLIVTDDHPEDVQELIRRLGGMPFGQEWAVPTGGDAHE